MCTIMYTSGTTGDPKGVMISNDSIIAFLAGVKHLLESVNEQVISYSFEPISYVNMNLPQYTKNGKYNSICFWHKTLVHMAI